VRDLAVSVVMAAAAATCSAALPQGAELEQLAAGRSEDEVIGFLSQRYGDYVLYKPPLRPSTWPLWFGPFALLGAGLWLLWRALKKQKGDQR